ncbi:hypothetical protein B0T42_08200 [Rathayibacter sp. VKM Ac-2630]|nr:hypothetical protein B0T42_08200 [Rathayibacter sp. VKM Ac-2630]
MFKTMLTSDISAACGHSWRAFDHLAAGNDDGSSAERVPVAGASISIRALGLRTSIRARCPGARANELPAEITTDPSLPAVFSGGLMVISASS